MRTPLTAETQLVELAAAVDGTGVIELTGGSESQEGVLLPGTLRARAVHPGRSVVSVSALDALSRRPLVGVEPVEIVIEVAE